jgi:hypothetical protein
MRQWNGRAPTSAQYDVGRLRAIGEWGQASRHVGSHWEQLGLDRLRETIAGQKPLALLAVCAHAALQEALAATGSKNPDVVLLFESADEVIAQPADLKWSLDVANYRQISAPVLAELLEKAPPLVAATRGLLPSDLGDHALVPRDGFFVSPRSLANERFLTSPENRRQEYPIEPAEVLFESVDPITFFEPLPGWLTGQELARIDGMARSLTSLDTADRYYHLGAGVAGALDVASRSIFEDDTDVDPTTEIVRLKEYVSTISPVSTGTILDRLGVVMRQRQQLQKTLRDLPRSAFTFKDFVGELKELGLITGDPIEPELRKQWSSFYWPVVEAQDAENRVVGRRLRAKGNTDVEALDRLTLERPTVAKRMRARALAMVEARRASVSESTTAPS